MYIFVSLRLFMSGLVLPALMANRFDIMELNPGARQDWAINPSLNSALIKRTFYHLLWILILQCSPGRPLHLCSRSMMGCWGGMTCCGRAAAGWSLGCPHSNPWRRSPSWCWPRPRNQGLENTCWSESQSHQHSQPGFYTLNFNKTERISYLEPF